MEVVVLASQWYKPAQTKVTASVENIWLDDELAAKLPNLTLD